MKSRLAAVSITALIIAAPAWAAESGNNNALNNRDKQFVQQVGAGNMAEAQLGKMAEQKAATPAVREFGRWMNTDHSFANKRLEAIAKPLNAWKRPQLTQAQEDMKQHLQQLSGQQFNQQYISGMLADHQKTIQLFQNEANQGQDQQLKTYAQNLLPVLRQHLDEVQELANGSNRMVNRSMPQNQASGSSIAPKEPPRKLH